MHVVGGIPDQPVDSPVGGRETTLGAVIGCTCIGCEEGNYPRKQNWYLRTFDLSFLLLMRLRVWKQPHNNQSSCTYSYFVCYLILVSICLNVEWETVWSVVYYLLLISISLNLEWKFILLVCVSTQDTTPSAQIVGKKPSFYIGSNPNVHTTSK